MVFIDSLIHCEQLLTALFTNQIKNPKRSIKNHVLLYLSRIMWCHKLIDLRREGVYLLFDPMQKLEYKRERISHLFDETPNVV